MSELEYFEALENYQMSDRLASDRDLGTLIGWIYLLIDNPPRIGLPLWYTTAATISFSTHSVWKEKTHATAKRVTEVAKRRI